MIRRLSLALFLLLAFLGSASGANKILKADIRHRPPEMIVDGKFFSGPLKEILEEAAAQIGRTVKWRSVPFSQSYVDLKGGRVDVVPRTIKKSEREAFIHFLGPIGQQHKDILFLVKKGRESSIRRYEDLRKLTIGVKAKTAYFKDFDKDPAIKKRTFEGGDYGLARMLIEERADAIAILDKAAMESALAGLGFKEFAYAVYRHGQTIENYFGLSKKSPLAKLAPELDRILEEMAASGRVDAIYAKYGAAPEAMIQGAIQLTVTEKQWLKTHPEPIRVHSEMNWPPFNFNQGGRPRGFSVDFMDLAAKKLGVRIDYVSGPSWAEFLEMAKSGDLDVMLNIVQTPERDKFLNFTDAYVENPPVIVTRKDNDDIRRLSDLKGRVVALPKGYFYQEIFERDFPGIYLLPLKDQVESLEAVAFGQADATVGGLAIQNHLIRKKALTSLKVAGGLDQTHFANKLRLGVRKDWPAFRSILNKAVRAVTPRELAALEEKWFGQMTESAPADDGHVTLTSEERAWLAAHPEAFRVHNEMDWPPFNFNEEGRAHGFSIGYMNLLAKKLGIRVAYVSGPDWSEFLGMLKSKKLDVMLNIIDTEERRKFARFTDSYMENPSVIIVRKGTRGIAKLRDLFGRTVAMPKGFFFEEIIKRKYPKIKILPVKDQGSALEAVSFGNAHAAIGELAVNNYLIRRKFLANLQVAGSIELGEFPDKLSLAVRDDWPVFQGILNKAIRSVTPQEMAQLKEAWFTREEKPGLPLTPEERAWLAAHPTIPIGVDGNWAPVDFMDDAGEHDGIAADYLGLMGERLGVTFKPVPGPTFNEMLAKVMSGTLKVGSTLIERPERAEKLLFTEPFYEALKTIITRKDHPDLTAIHGLADLHGRRVAVVDGFSIQKVLAKEHPEITLAPYKNPTEALKALSFGKADAYVGSQAAVSWIMQEEQLVNLTVAADAGLPTSPQSFAVAKEPEWAPLAGLLDKALASITREERREILQRWIFARAPPKAEEPKVRLTAAEKAWLRDHPEPLRIAGTADWPPFELRDEQGRFQGISADFLALIARRTGLSVDVTFAPWSDLLAALKNKTMDVAPDIKKTPEREHYLAFTKPYLESSHVMIVRNDREDLKGFDDLMDQTVAVEKDWYLHEFYRTEHPTLKLLVVENSLAALRAVSEGKADAFISGQATATYIMERNVLTNLKIAAFIDAAPPFRMSMAVRKDWPLLRDILQKGLDSVTEKEKKEIYSRYITIVGPAPSAPRASANLTPEEKAWLAAHPEIRLGVDANWPPFASFDARGSYVGIGADFMRLLGRNLGVRLNAIPGLTFSEVLKRYKAGRIDMLPSAVDTPARRAFINFTAPYVVFNNVIVRRDGSPPITGLRELRGKKVGAVKGFATHELLTKRYPQLVVVAHENVKEGLLAASLGKTSGFFGNEATVRHFTRELFLNNLNTLVPTEHTFELSVGVRKDWPELVPIVEKGLAAISREEKDEIFRRAGLGPAKVRAAADLKEEGYTDLALQVGFLAVVIIALFVMMSWLVKRASAKDASALYDSPELRKIGFLIIALFLCIVLLSAWYAIHRVEDQVREEMGDSLQTVLNATVEGVRLWVDSKKQALKMAADAPQVVAQVEKLLRTDAQPETLRNHRAQLELRAFFSKRERQIQQQGFFIISPDGRSLGSRRDANLGSVNLIYANHKALLDNVFKGAMVMIPPMASDVPLVDAAGVKRERPPTLFFAGPVRNALGEVIAAITLRFDPGDDFTRIVQLGRIGQSGETYAFGPRGQFLSGSRFDRQLRKIGLLGAEENSILALRLRDPGGNLLEGFKPTGDPEELSLTHMASEALAGRDGLNVKGYRDYRGVPVMGAWLWDRTLGFGMATEIDVDETLSSYYATRNTLWGVLGVTVLFSLILTGLAVWIGQSANRSLQRARDTLEETVAQRTAELKGSQERLELALEGGGLGFWDINFANDRLVVDERWARMLDRDRDEIEPSTRGTWLETIHPDDRKAVLDAGEAYRRGEIPGYEVEYRALTKTGEVVWLLSKGVIVERDAEGEPLRMVGTVQDITRRKTTEEALAESEGRSRLILESVGDGIFGLDGEGRTTFVNPAAAAMLGFSEEELTGVLMHAAVHHTRPDGSAYPQEACPMRAAFADGRSRQVNDEALWRKDGTSFPVEYSAVPMKKGGALVGAVVIFRDITERLRVEHELRDKLEELEKFNSVAVGRELKMIALKEEINELWGELGKEARYEIPE